MFETKEKFDINSFDIFSEYKKKLHNKLTLNDNRHVNWRIFYLKIFKKWLENKNNDDIFFKINLIRNNYKKSFKIFEENKNDFHNLNHNLNNLINTDNLISQQLIKKLQYKIKRNYKLNQSIDNKENKKNSNKKFFNFFTESKESSSKSIKNKIIFERPKMANKFNLLKKEKSISNIFRINSFETSANSFNSKYVNKTPKLKKIIKNQIKNTSTFFNKFIPKKLINPKFNSNNNLQYNDSSIEYLSDYSIKAIYFNKIKLKLKSHSLINKDLKIPLFFEQLEVMKRKDKTEIYRKKKRNFNNEKYTQMFNLQDIIFDDKIDYTFEVDIQILNAKKTCDIIINKFNPIINKDSQLMNLEKYGI